MLRAYYSWIVSSGELEWIFDCNFIAMVSGSSTER